MNRVGRVTLCPYRRVTAMDCPVSEGAGAHYRHRQATAHAQATLLGNLILCVVGNASMLWRLGVALMRAEQPSEGCLVITSDQSYHNAVQFCSMG